MGPKPRKSELWTMHNELKLIEWMRNRPFMWDSTHKEYFHMESKRILYKAIAEDLGSEFTSGMVRDRWTNMRTTFAANYRRANAMKNKSLLLDTNQPSSPSWQLYSHLSFLEPTVELRNSSNGQQMYLLEPTGKEEMVFKMEEEDAGPPLLEQEEERPLCMIAETTGGSTVEDPEASTPGRTVSSLPRVIYRYDYHEDRESRNATAPPSEDGCSNQGSTESFPVATTTTATSPLPPKFPESTAVCIAPPPVGREAGDDEWDDFGRMVSKILRRMPERDAREVQMEFFRILFSKSSHVNGPT